MKTYAKYRAEQLPKTAKEAINNLEWLLSIATYDDLNATTDAGAKKLLARWFLGHACIEKLKIDLKIK